LVAWCGFFRIDRTLEGLIHGPPEARSEPMAIDGQVQRIVRLYPDDCQPHDVEPLAAADSFSGAALWRLATPRGTLCLRRWPSEHPTPERLEFIQAVLWHVDQEGFRRIPLPLETSHHHGFVRHAGHLWELAPWLPGAANFRQSPSIRKLQNALAALAGFHQAAASFPLAEAGRPTRSPGIGDRTMRLQALVGGRLAQLRRAIDRQAWPELAGRATRLIGLAEGASPRLLPVMEAASQLEVAVQPCIRDVWHAHVLFVGDDVSGFVDFGSLRPDNVAADVARLLGSLAGDNRADWQRGLDAYQTVRRLSDDELALVTAFDRSTVLMGGLQWLEWFYLEGRTFENRQAVLERVDEFVARLSSLAQQVS
jgi:Ser/Thr protein kinase RdoA (MazF antagonist)